MEIQYLRVYPHFKHSAALRCSILVDFTALKDRLGCFQPKLSDLDTAIMIDVLMSAFGQFHIAGSLKRALGPVG